MLRWISKSGTFLQFAIFIVIMSAFWIPAFVNSSPAVIKSSDGPLFTLLVSWLKHTAGTVSVALALSLIVLQAISLFYVFQANGFFGRSNFMPALIILVTYSWNADFQTLHAILPAGIFIILAIHSIMVMYGKQEAYRQVFTAAFSIGIASLFYLPLAYLLFLIWFSFITYRISTWREYAISIIGFSIPFIYYFSWLFWSDTFNQGLHQLAAALFNFVLPARISTVNTLWLFVSAFLIMVTMAAVLNSMSDKLISLRRKSWVVFNYSLTAVLVIFLAGWPILSANYLFAIPLSFFVTGSFTLIKRPFWFEMMALSCFLFLIMIRVYLAL